MANTINLRIQQRYDVVSEWQNSEVILLRGEVAYDETGRYKVGDGSHIWSELPYGDVDVQTRLGSVEVTLTAAGTGVIARLTDVEGGVESVAQDVADINSRVGQATVGTKIGIASLGEDGIVPSTQLPSFVDDVMDAWAGYTEDEVKKENWLYASATAENPLTPEKSKIYIVVGARFTEHPVEEFMNKTYRWSGSQYVEISKSIVIGTGTGQAYEGSKGVALENRVTTIEEAGVFTINEMNTYMRGSITGTAQVMGTANKATGTGYISMNDRVMFFENATVISCGSAV